MRKLRKLSNLHAENAEQFITLTPISIYAIGDNQMYIFVTFLRRDSGDLTTQFERKKLAKGIQMNAV